MRFGELSSKSFIELQSLFIIFDCISFIISTTEKLPLLFKEFDFDEGVPYVSVTKNGITFNKGVVLKLGRPPRAVLLINSESKQVVIRGCGDGTPKSNAFFKANERGIVSVRWNSKDLLSTIKTLMNWNLDTDSYRIEGQLLSDDGAMLFDFNQAEKLS